MHAYVLNSWHHLCRCQSSRLLSFRSICARHAANPDTTSRASAGLMMWVSHSTAGPRLDSQCCRQKSDNTMLKCNFTDRSFVTAPHMRAQCVYHAALQGQCSSVSNPSLRAPQPRSLQLLTTTPSNGGTCNQPVIHGVPWSKHRSIA